MIDIIGWIGSVMVVLAYGLNITGKLSSDAMSYYLLNIAGSAMLIVNTIYHNALPSAAINVVWIVIAVIALFRKKRKTQA